MISFKSKKVIGLDIGTSTIKVAEAEVSSRGITLQSFAMMQTPTNAINNGDIADAGAISAVIMTLINQLKTKNKNVSIGLWGSAVIVKKLTTPRIQQKLIDQQIRWEAEQYIPFDINNVALDYHVINSGSAETMDIILVAAQNEVVFQYSEVVQMSGLNNSIMDVAGFALANCFEANYGKMMGETVGIINFGAGVTNFVAIQNGEVVFSRDVPVGGVNYTNEIHKELGVTTIEAEALKLSAAQKKEVPDEVHSIISATTESVCEELKNSFDFFSATTNGLVLSRCFVTGGGAQLPGLIDQIGKVVNAPAERMNPFLKVKFNHKKLDSNYMNQVSPYLSVVMGLAMRELGDR